MGDLRSPASSAIGRVFSAALLATTAASVTTAATAKKALILDTTVQGGASSREASSARTAGFDVTVADAATWTAMTRDGFAAYDVLILGDPNCGSVGALAPAEANPDVWGAAVNGNVAVLLTDPDFHAAFLSAPQKLMDNAISFAGAQAGRTGLYASLSCYYAGAAPGTPVPALGGIGTFTVQGQGGCPNSIHILDPASPVVSGLSEADLSNWSCSAHGGFDAWPGNFNVVAMVRDIVSGFVAPDGTTGTPYILTSGNPCDAATLPRPDPVPFGAFTWTADLSVSDADGLIARNVALGPRFMADQISVPYFHLETANVSVPRGELTPAGDQATGRTRLIGFREFFGDPAGVEATYAVDRIPAGSRSCLIIHQRYEFQSEQPDGGCEPSASLQARAGPVTFPIPSAGSLPCNRWKPRIDYQFIPADGDVLTSINIPQRLFFKDDAVSPNLAATFEDDDVIKLVQVKLDNGVKVDIADPILRRQDIGTEGTFKAIARGAAGDWDNYHQSFKPITAPVGFPLPAPGCPECVHIHWRWGAPAGQAFGDGRPLIPPKSDQDVEFAVTLQRPGEEHPADFKALVDGESLAGQDVVFWYSATGHQPSDTFFDHGAFFSTEGIADLQLTMTSSPKNVAPQGDRVTYSITVQNKGPGTATGVVVGDTWSKPQTTFNAALSSPECQGGGQQAICKLGTLDSGTITFLTIVLDVNSLNLDYPLIDVASVSSRQKDPTPDDNRAVARTAIR
jgi:uncharacterized repeat protein (TIGR01451 family)